MSLFGRSEPFVSEWFSAQPGSEVPWTGGRDVVRSIAVYDLEVVDGEPGDGHRVTLVCGEG